MMDKLISGMDLFEAQAIALAAGKRLRVAEFDRQPVALPKADRSDLDVAAVEAGPNDLRFVRVVAA